MYAEFRLITSRSNERMRGRIATGGSSKLIIAMSLAEGGNDSGGQAMGRGCPELCPWKGTFLVRKRRGTADAQITHVWMIGRVGGRRGLLSLSNEGQLNPDLSWHNERSLDLGKLHHEGIYEGDYVA